MNETKKDLYIIGGSVTFLLIPALPRSVFMVFHGTRLVFHRAERRRREARHETYITPKLVTTQRSILGPPAEGRPGPSDDDDDDDDDEDGEDDVVREGVN